MCEFCKNCSEESENCVCCPECFIQCRSLYELTKDMVEVLISRQEAGNVFILAAAKALENNAEDPVAIIDSINEFMAELEIVDDTVFDLLDIVDELESFSCEECFCIGCPYAQECDGECYFDEEDFFVEENQETT